jgi:hypothetical protein
VDFASTASVFKTYYGVVRRHIYSSAVTFKLLSEVRF